MLGHRVAFELDVLSTVAATQVQNQARKAAKMSANPGLDTAEVAGSDPRGRGGKGRGRGRGRARGGRSAVQPSEVRVQEMRTWRKRMQRWKMKPDKRYVLRDLLHSSRLQPNGQQTASSKGRKKDKQQDSTGSHVLECVLLGSVM